MKFFKKEGQGSPKTGLFKDSIFSKKEDKLLPQFNVARKRAKAKIEIADKRENVVAYLNKADQVTYCRWLQDAYSKTVYKEVVEALKEILWDLEKSNQSAAHSLPEGIDETLTIHEPGLLAALAKRLSTTNFIEGFMSQIGAYTDKVDRSGNSRQIQRWTAASAVGIELRLPKIKVFRYLILLRTELIEIVATIEGQSAPLEVFAIRHINRRIPKNFN